MAPQHSPQPHPGSTAWPLRRGTLWLLGMGVICSVILIWFFQARNDKRSAQVIEASALALRESRFGDAARLAEDFLEHSSAHPTALVVAARAAAAQRNWSQAFLFCDRLQAEHRNHAVQLLLTEGKSLVEDGKARRAEERLRLALHIDPENTEATYVLAFIYGAEGRAWEAVPLVKTLVSQNQFDIPQLLILGATEEFFIDQPAFVQKCLSAEPSDRLITLVQARLAETKNDSARAGSLLRQLRESDPWLIEPHARWGRWLIEHQRLSEVPDWNRALPPESDTHPEVWAVRGLWSLETNQIPAAIHCFLQAARLDPNHRLANLQLGNLLASTGRSQLAIRFQQRTALLSELGVPLTTFLQQRDAELLRRVVVTLEKLGRIREAVAWSELYLRSSQDLTWAPQLIQRLRQPYPQELPWLLHRDCPANDISLSDYPAPDWQVLTKTDTNPSQVDPASKSTAIRFAEEAEKLGIQFQFQNDARKPDQPLRMFEFLSGGGLGVLDYDGDGWSDLYASQGGPFPPVPDAARPIDRIFRNLEGRGFVDLTESARLDDAFYSQGVAVGDFDQDGMPDILVANIGCNQLYLNLGDGTFQNVTTVAGLNDADWTSSCLLADLNGDTLPDIFGVNYLGGDDVYTRICGSDDHRKSCLPTAFMPQQDRLWINQGNGTFVEQTERLVQETAAGRGLGIVATRGSRPELLNIFVANDTDANFWYVNQSDAITKELRWEESGVADGLAFDANGNPQASMGIAAGDVNHDGLLDLFVTNFYRESNTLYLQSADGLFQDQTREFGLRDPSFLQLGFGTQFLDADSDGWLDLIVTNGHVYNNTHLNEPFRMSPQFFRNSGRGSFSELSAEELGTWFAGKYLGRALVHWDWNRDLRPDAVIAHADVPLAILTNRTDHSNHAVSLSLHGVQSNRDAIGTVVHATIGKDHSTYWITAGDGYQGSNERKMILGMGQAQRIDEISIQWPSGISQTLKNVPADQELILIEGRPPVSTPTRSAITNRSGS